jgi:hypothetical protein
MPKQRIELIIGAVVETDSWNFEPQALERLRNWAEIAVQDQITQIQGGEPEGYDNNYVEIEYGELL